MSIEAQQKQRASEVKAKFWPKGRAFVRVVPVVEPEPEPLPPARVLNLPPRRPLNITGIDYVHPAPLYVYRMDDIKRAVYTYYNIAERELISQRRHPSIVLPRQIAMYLCKEMTTQSHPQVGRAFEGRDHTTCLHACRKIAALIDSDPDILAQVDSIKSSLQEAARRCW